MPLFRAFFVSERRQTRQAISSQQQQQQQLQSHHHHHHHPGIQNGVPVETTSSMMFSFPMPTMPNEEGLNALCFPDQFNGSVLRKTPSGSNLKQFLYSQSYLRRGPNSFVFVLTQEDGSNLYGCCVRRDSIHTENENDELITTCQRCYCVLSEHPYFGVHFALLYRLLVEERTITMHCLPSDTMVSKQTEAMKMQANSFEWSLNILRRLYDCSCAPYSPRQIAKALELEETLPLELTLLPLCEETSHHLQIWSIPVLCRAISLPTLLHLCAWALLEQRIAISSTCVGVLSAVCISTICLIHPLKWTSTFVPLLPVQMHVVLESPVAYIVGISGPVPQPESIEPPLILDVRNDKLYSPPSLRLPPFSHFHSLQLALQPLYESLRGGGGAGKDGEYSPSTFHISQEDAQNAILFANITHAMVGSVVRQTTPFLKKTGGEDGMMGDVFVDTAELVELWEEEDREFVTQLVGTQQFMCYAHELLDGPKPRTPAAMVKSPEEDIDSEDDLVAKPTFDKSGGVIHPSDESSDSFADAPEKMPTSEDENSNNTNGEEDNHHLLPPVIAAAQEKVEEVEQEEDEDDEREGSLSRFFSAQTTTSGINNNNNPSSGLNSGNSSNYDSTGRTTSIENVNSVDVGNNKNSNNNNVVVRHEGSSGDIPRDGTRRDSLEEDETSEYEDDEEEEEEEEEDEDDEEEVDVGDGNNRTSKRLTGLHYYTAESSSNSNNNTNNIQQERDDAQVSNDPQEGEELETNMSSSLQQQAENSVQRYPAHLSQQATMELEEARKRQREKEEALAQQVQQEREIAAANARARLNQQQSSSGPLASDPQRTEGNSEEDISSLMRRGDMETRHAQAVAARAEMRAAVEAKLQASAAVAGAGRKPAGKPSEEVAQQQQQQQTTTANTNSNTSASSSLGPLPPISGVRPTTTTATADSRNNAVTPSKSAIVTAPPSSATTAATPAATPAAAPTATPPSSKKPRLCGVGAKFAVDNTNHRFFVKEVKADGPAALDGRLRVGNFVMAVDGKEVSGMTVKEFTDLVLGLPGSMVRFKVHVDDRTPPIILELVRQPTSIGGNAGTTPAPMSSGKSTSSNVSTGNSSVALSGRNASSSAVAAPTRPSTVQQQQPQRSMMATSPSSHSNHSSSSRTSNTAAATHADAAAAAKVVARQLQDRMGTDRISLSNSSRWADPKARSPHEFSSSSSSDDDDEEEEEEVDADTGKMRTFKPLPPSSEDSSSSALDARLRYNDWTNKFNMATNQTAGTAAAATAAKNAGRIPTGTSPAASPSNNLLLADLQKLRMELERTTNAAAANFNNTSSSSNNNNKSNTKRNAGLSSPGGNHDVKMEKSTDSSDFDGDEVGRRVRSGGSGNNSPMSVNQYLGAASAAAAAVNGNSSASSSRARPSTGSFAPFRAAPQYQPPQQQHQGATTMSDTYQAAVARYQELTGNNTSKTSTSAGGGVDPYRVGAGSSASMGFTGLNRQLFNQQQQHSIAGATTTTTTAVPNRYSNSFSDSDDDSESAPIPARSTAANTRNLPPQASGNASRANKIPSSTSTSTINNTNNYANLPKGSRAAWMNGASEDAFTASAAAKPPAPSYSASSSTSAAAAAAAATRSNLHPAMAQSPQLRPPRNVVPAGSSSGGGYNPESSPSGMRLQALQQQYSEYGSGYNQNVRRGSGNGSGLYSPTQSPSSSTSYTTAAANAGAAGRWGGSSSPSGFSSAALSQQQQQQQQQQYGAPKPSSSSSGPLPRYSNEAGSFDAWNSNTASNYYRNAPATTPQRGGMSPSFTGGTSPASGGNSTPTTGPLPSSSRLRGDFMRA